MLNEKNKKYYVPNLLSAIRVLETLSKSAAPLSQKEIAQTAKLGTSIVFRILVTLEDCGYVNKSSDRKYSISKRFLPMSYAAANEDNIVKNSMDILAETRDTLLETTMLGVLADGIFPVVLQELGKHSFSFHCKIGTPCPLHTGAACKAVIAFLPERERAEVVSKIAFEKYNANTIVSKKAYERELAEVRKLGYAVDREEYIRGMHCVAVPVFNGANYPVAGIWITGPVERTPESSFAETGKYLAAQAKKISDRIVFGA